MASIAVTAAWSDPTGNLTDGASYIIQNRSTGPIQIYEGSTFDANTNANDGVILTAMHDGGAGPNHMLWTYTASNAVRVRMTGGGFGGVNGNLLEFFPAV